VGVGDSLMPPPRRLSLGERNALSVGLLGSGSNSMRRVQVFSGDEQVILLNESGLLLNSDRGSIPELLKLGFDADHAAIFAKANGDLILEPGHSGSGVSVQADSDDSSDLGAAGISWRNIYAYSLHGNGGIRFVAQATGTDAAKIQEAIDASELAGGGIIVIPEGTYDINTPLILDADVPILMLGYGAVLRATAANMEAVIKIDRLNGDAASFLAIQGISINGNKASYANNRGIRIIDTDKVRLTDIKIENCGKEGLDLYIGTSAGAGTSWVEFCQFERLQIQACGTGVHFNRGAEDTYTSCFGNTFQTVGVGNCTIGWDIDRYANLTRCVFKNTVTWLEDSQTGWNINGDMKEVQADLHVESQGTPTSIKGIVIGSTAVNMTRWSPHYSFVGNFNTKIEDGSNLLYQSWQPLPIMSWVPVKGSDGATYTAGDAYQSGNTVTGVGTTWTDDDPRMVGRTFTFGVGGGGGTITARASNTSITVSNSATVGGSGDRKSYTISAPAAAPMLFSSGGSSNSGNDYSGWFFDDGGFGILREIVRVPDDYVGDDLTFAIEMLWTTPDAAPVGTVRWAIHVGAIQPDGSTYTLNHTTGDYSVTPAVTSTFASTYSTGSASQSSSTVTGSGTTWTSDMIGSYFVFDGGGGGGLISARASNTSITVGTSATVSSGTYVIGDAPHIMRKIVWYFTDPLTVRRGDCLRIAVLRDGNHDTLDSTVNDIVLVSLALAYKRYN